jgi:outer membrane protein TolC
VPTLAEALREATAHRPEIEQAEMSLQNQQVVLEATKNALLPSLDAYGSYDLSGLGGSLRPTIDNIFQNDFPNFSFGLRLEMPLRNRTAQADSTRALLEQRRLQMRLQDARNVAVWDVSKAVSGVDQARRQLEAATKLVKLALQVVQMQHQKFTMELATVEEYITAQQNLAIARGHVVKAHAAYAKALIQYEKATGTLLDRNNIEMSEAVHGEVRHLPKAP